MKLSSSELILNDDGSIYHLKLLPVEIAEDIITVGDPDRIDLVTKHFDSIELDKRSREFRTVTGHCRGKRLSVVSTGIGTDNIDIVFNELDALVNIDLETRRIKDKHTSLRFYRIGTSGTLRTEIPIDSLLISKYAIGLGGLSHYYQKPESIENSSLLKRFNENWPLSKFVQPYVVSSSSNLYDQFIKSRIFLGGITLTANGFYGPQGRSLRLDSAFPNLELISSIDYDDLHITNLEMETAGIYLLAQLLGHEAISCNALLANRQNGEFSSDPQKAINNLIKHVLDLITSREDAGEANI